MHRLISPVSNRTSVPDDAPVAWIGGRPADDDALAVWQALNEDHVTTVAALVERTGDRLFRRDLDVIGGAADVGFFRPFYLAHARRIVATLAGTLLRIGPAA